MKSNKIHNASVIDALKNLLTPFFQFLACHAVVSLPVSTTMHFFQAGWPFDCFIFP